MHYGTPRPYDGAGHGVYWSKTFCADMYRDRKDAVPGDFVRTKGKICSATPKPATDSCAGGVTS